MLEPPTQSLTSRLGAWLGGSSARSTPATATSSVSAPLKVVFQRGSQFLRQRAPAWLSDGLEKLEPHLLSILTAALAVLLIAILITTIAQIRHESARPVSIAVPDAVQPGWKGLVLPYPTISSKTHPRLITCYDPSTAQHISDVHADDASAIFEKIRRAQTAQRGWADSDFARRRRVLRTIKQWLANDMDVVVKVACRDTGKTVSCHAH